MGEAKPSLILHQGSVVAPKAMLMAAVKIKPVAMNATVRPPLLA